MTGLKKILFLSAATFFFLLAIITILGLLSPRTYHGSIEGTINTPISTVWDELSSLEHIPVRHPEITRVELLSTTAEGYRQWKEYTDLGGYIIFETTDEVSEKKLVNKMDDSSFGMTGTWTYQLAPINSSSTQITITEDSTISRLYLRAIMTLIGREKNLAAELTSFQTTP